MQPFPAAGYDKGISIFSPDGRLFQVEYAREAVKRGTTSLGVKSSEGIVLVVDKRPSSKLVEPTSIEKIFQIDEHIGAATSGLVADARKLIEQARMESQVNKITFNEPIPVEMLAKKICDMKQMYTQHGGVRPFGSALIIGGVNDNGCRLFETDPSGALIEYKATAIGAGRALAMEVFEKSYSEDMKFPEAMDLALNAIYEATEGKTTKESVEIAVIEEKNHRYRKLTENEIEDHVEELLIRKSKEGEEEEE
ncbi:archaeal proteasome endopeptidase complex subunit alpha [Methanobacterium petrolearium]|uniref:archaeal proteasome endopeptidase complex subunit alpha n=1 Tax=Methanobacterium petrolearium TaxID=710190 RepID=UPI001AE98D5F|nr:archaeal proteasome endopeptidase complex subunit alpha [Methanobacterium petrolearium]MBP1946074.1 proteasome alpha subunit [Methanobacterium petrolearium]BDZ70790.1 proteasome endopeptidase complex,subunit alpha [Methanobacterium petrolearium]